MDLGFRDALIYGLRMHGPGGKVPWVPIPSLPSLHPATHPGGLPSAQSGGEASSSPPAATAAAARSLFACLSARLQRDLRSRQRSLLCATCKTLGEWKEWKSDYPLPFGVLEAVWSC